MALPTVRGGAQALYPLTKRIVFDTGVMHNSDATEQRWKRRAPLWEFEWSYRSLLKADAASLVTFFNGIKGSYGAFSFTLGATTFGNLNLLSDILDIQQSGPNEHDARFVARQTQNRGWTAPSWPSGAWPTFSSGASLQLPFGPGYRRLTTAGDSPTGTRYPYSWWGNGLSGLPSGPLRKFSIDLTLPDADAATMETFCSWSQGRLNTWNFADPCEGLAYYKMRFDTDSFEFNYLDVNQVQVRVPLVEIN